ncbi:hypothetical protein GF345_01650 [Candidatus Woesearchaeota archaeon]|nr:hypothetical protein [Candidatus Woesearchaeota archaeon]
MASNNLDDGLRTGYFKGLTECLDRLSCIEQNPYIQQISGILKVYLSDQKHEQGRIEKVTLNPNSGLPDGDTLKELKSEIDHSRGCSYVDANDLITSFLKKSLLADHGDVDGNTREQLYWSELKNLSRSINGFSTDRLNYECRDKRINMFFTVSNYYDFFRDGMWISYLINFSEHVEAKINGNLRQLQMSQFLDATTLFHHLYTEVGLTPLELKEGVIGPFAYSGIRSRSQYSGLCTAPDSFVLEYSRRSMDYDHTSKARAVLCSENMEFKIRDVSPHTAVIPVGGESDV